MAAIALVVLLAAPVRSQVVGANIGGIVTDETGAALPGVTVTITNKANGRQQVVVTGPEGNYRAVALQPAAYEITADLSGFTTVRREITLTVGAAVTLDVKLGVAAVQETITVTGETPLVEVAKSQPSSAVVSEQVSTLPVLERNFLTLAQLLPGSAPDNSRTQRFAVTKFGGVADQRNGFTTVVDGGDIDDAIWGSPTINFTQDAVQEFKVFRNQFDAEYGRALAAVVTVVTKSGTNNLSGTGFYFGRDRELNARNAFARTKPPFDQQRLGASAGGPVVLNRTHFFGVYEYNNVDTVRIIALPSSNPFAARENGVFPSGSNNHMAAAKIDHRANDAHSFFARYAYDNQEALRTSQVSSDSNNIDDFNRTHSLIGGDNWVMAQNRVNTIRIHLLKHNLWTLPRSTDLGIARPSATFGQSQVNPQYFPRTRLSFYDTLYVNTPRHDVKIGGEFTWTSHDFEAHFFERGIFTFTTDAPFTPDDPRTWPISFVQQKPGFYNYKSSEIALFVQDDWRIVPRVRINLGLRYDLDTNLRINKFYTGLLADPAFAGFERFVSGDRGTDSNNLQPRVGATWDIRGDGTLVARGGVGMYVTRNRPWFELRSMNQLTSSAVRIEDPQRLEFFPDISAVLGGRTLDEFIAAGGARLLGTVIPDNYVLPYAMSTTAGLGWQLGRATSLDVDYVHSYGNHQLGFTDRNLPESGPISRMNPRPLPQFTQVLMLENFTKSWYDALEMQLRTRVRGANSLQVSYTLSRSYMDGVDFFNNLRGTQRTPDERGYNPTDQRHNLTAAGSISLPWDVQVSGILKLISGSPFKVQTGFDIDGDGSIISDRPPGVPITVGREQIDEPLRIMNELRASRGLPPVDATLLKLDPFRSLDLRVTKGIRFGPRQRVELLVEAFNLTNFVNQQPFSVNQNIISPSFLIRNSARDGRQIQWGVRYEF